MRQTLGRFGRRGARVLLWVEGDRIRAQWRDRGERRSRSWPDTQGNRREAKEWARTFSAQRLERTQPRSLLTTAQIWATYGATEFAHLRPRTIAFYQESWRYWSVFVGPERIAEDLGVQTMTEFRRDMETRPRPLAINTMRRVIQTVKTVYAWGKAQKLLSQNDVQGFTFKVAKEKRPQSPGEYRREEFDRIRAQLPLDRAKTWRAGGAIALLGYQGAREKSVLHLRWEDIDLETDTIHWRPEWDKLGRDEYQPLRPAAKAVLVAIRHWTQGRGWIFPAVHQRSRQPTYDKQSLWYALMGAEDRANIAHRPNRALHGLRRMVFNEVMEASKDLGVAMAAIRDTDLKVASKYLQVRHDRLRETFAAMDRKGNANDTVHHGELRKSMGLHTGAAGFEPATSREQENPQSPEIPPAIEGETGETPRNTPLGTHESVPETAPATANQPVERATLGSPNNPPDTQSAR